MFNKYNHIDNIAKANIHTTHEEWVATEKIHGSNLQFIVCENEILTGRRKALLGENEDFYNYQQVRDHLRPKLYELRKLVGCDINVYGEIFGGIYPSATNFQELNSGVAVQKGIYYCPDNRFAVFDIYKNGGGYLDYDYSKELCNQVDLLFAEPLHRGTCAEMKALNPVFETTYPSRLGLPEIEKNYAEGYVIRPVVENRRGKRMIYKLKAPQYTERVKVKVQTPKNSCNPPTDRAEMLVSEIAPLICKPRLDNVLSNLPVLNKPKDLLTEIYKGKLISDAINEYSRENNVEINKNEKKYINTVLEPNAREIVANLT